MVTERTTDELVPQLRIPQRDEHAPELLHLLALAEQVIDLLLAEHEDGLGCRRRCSRGGRTLGRGDELGPLVFTRTGDCPFVDLGRGLAGPERPAPGRQAVGGGLGGGGGGGGEGGEDHDDNGRECGGQVGQVGVGGKDR